MEGTPASITQAQAKAEKKPPLASPFEKSSRFRRKVSDSGVKNVRFREKCQIPEKSVRETGAKETF